VGACFGLIAAFAGRLLPVAGCCRLFLINQGGVTQFSCDGSCNDDDGCSGYTSGPCNKKEENGSIWCRCGNQTVSMQSGWCTGQIIGGTPEQVECGDTEDCDADEDCEPSSDPYTEPYLGEGTGIWEVCSCQKIT